MVCLVAKDDFVFGVGHHEVRVVREEFDIEVTRFFFENVIDGEKRELKDSVIPKGRNLLDVRIDDFFLKLIEEVG